MSVVDYVGEPELEREPDADELDWMRDEHDRLEANQQAKADAMNECEHWVGSSRQWVVVAGRAVIEGTKAHAQLRAQEFALAARRDRLVGIARPAIRVRTCGRTRRGRRSTQRRSPARSPGRLDPDRPARPLELEAAA